MNQMQLMLVFCLFIKCSESFKLQSYSNETTIVFQSGKYALGDSVARSSAQGHFEEFSELRKSCLYSGPNFNARSLAVVFPSAVSTSYQNLAIPRSISSSSLATVKKNVLNSTTRDSSDITVHV